MKNLRIYILITIFSTFSAASAQDTSRNSNNRQLQQKCITNKNDITEAVVAEDWDRLFIMAIKYMTECGDIFGKEWLAEAHENRATFYQKNSDFKMQLQAAEECLSINYGHTGCHVHKGEVLMRQKNYAESRVSARRSINLANFQIENQKKEVERGQSRLDKEVAQSKIRELESTKAWAISLIEFLDTIESIDKRKQK
jgi:hypothetical protein